KFSSVFTRLQSAAAAADRIFAFLDRQPSVRTNAGGVRLGRRGDGVGASRAAASLAGAADARENDAPPSPHLEFRDVCFSYEPGKPILSHVNLAIGTGEKVAVVGPNGSGKTTLLSLVPRFYDPDHGALLIDGYNLRHVHLRSLRQQIGLVMQDPFLFDDTIFNNIAYGHRAAKPEAIEAAARAAFAHDFIVKLPKGYHTPVGEAGGKLSGGQKQRIALARAVLRNPSILILDEFTSQYDPESEAILNRALREFMRNRTTFVITH